MRIETIKAHESTAIEAIVHLRVGFPALRANNATYITILVVSHMGLPGPFLQKLI